MRFTYYDFFAGGGMVSFGLGPNWDCLFANEIDEKKAVSYRVNHNGGHELRVDDVANVSLKDLPKVPDLVWASFPCQDLSVAGKGRGLAGERSGAFRPFWDLVRKLGEEGRGPKIVAIENVCGAIKSNGGRDFATLAEAFDDIGYRFGAVVIDAVHFLPQSRPRFFMFGIRPDLNIPKECVDSGPSALWHTPALVEGVNLLSKKIARNWSWWRLVQPPPRNISLSSVISENPSGVEWHRKEETKYLLEMMSDVNREKVLAAQSSQHRVVGTVYRRTRKSEKGERQQRAEVRFDEIAGCLRTPSGGSSRQTIIVVEGESIRSRLLSPREAALLMGLPCDYQLPERYNDAYKLAGDGVAVPVVKHLAENIFEPILEQNRLALIEQEYVPMTQRKLKAS